MKKGWQASAGIGCTWYVVPAQHQSKAFLLKTGLGFGPSDRGCFGGGSSRARKSAKANRLVF
ncbi:MAG: hypothetical protein R2825_18210 [Saprospiraceae bacterium]